MSPAKSPGVLYARDAAPDAKVRHSIVPYGTVLPCAAARLDLKQEYIIILHQSLVKSSNLNKIVCRMHMERWFRV